MSFEKALAIKRVELARLNTPLHPVNWRWQDAQLLLKRDDLTGAALSGNKVRKLEYILAEAQSRDCDIVLTCGGIQSNHARATAIAARRLGIDSCLVLSGDPSTPPDGNNLLARLAGATIRFVQAANMTEREQQMDQIADEFFQRGRHPFVIPTGGSDALGVLGYLRCAKELGGDLASLSRHPAHIVTAVGSGGTFGGLYLGMRCMGLNLSVIGSVVDSDTTYWASRLAKYLQECDQRWELGAYDTDQPLELINATGLGYAQNTDAEIDFIIEFASKTGIMLDPVYTGKALYAFDREVREGRLPLRGDVVFVHTGGIFGLGPARDMIVERFRF